jgi:hypothetical protein
MKMVNDDAILDVARSIRPYLSDLLSEASAAAAVDRDLAGLLADARDGRAVDVAICARLELDPAMHAWAAAFLQHGVPPEERPKWTRGAGDGPSGDVSASISPDVFVCPQGDYKWWRRAVGVPAPVCPTHRVALERQT